MMCITSLVVINLNSCRFVRVDNPCLIFYLGGKALNFPPLSIMLAVSLSYMAFIMLGYVSSNPNILGVFIMNGY